MRIKEFITICLLLVSVSLFAQEKTIEVTGVVTDTNKEPLVGVNVTVKDKPGLGAITDINGRYKINIEEFSRLVFSYIGFDTQEILVKRQSLVNVSMKESDAREIDEVVITGTGAQKKLTVTGADSKENTIPMPEELPSYTLDVTKDGKITLKKDGKEVSSGTIDIPEIPEIPTYKEFDPLLLTVKDGYVYYDGTKTSVAIPETAKGSITAILDEKGNYFRVGSRCFGSLADGI